jgi:N-acetylglucosaminyl-diphospho-decaprenol L-rhamnosyltransferase
MVVAGNSGLNRLFPDKRILMGRGMNRHIDLSIVIVNYNTADFTAQCLDSIAANPPAGSYEIVVVDNASSDGSADRLEAQYPFIKLMRSSENKGIAGGNNLGIQASSGRFILLLNNDTLVLPGALDRVINFLDHHPDVGGAGGQLLNPDGSFQAGFVNFPSLLQEFLIVSKIGGIFRSYYPSHPPSDVVREVDWMSTAFMLFRREALEEVGLVDEEYFIYSDETDLEYRLRQAGWKIVYLPEVKTVHFGGKSLNPWRRRKMVYRGYLLFYHKHYERWKTLVLRGVLAGISAMKLPIWMIAYLLPVGRERARNELVSNVEILRMCVRPGIGPPG